MTDDNHKSETEEDGANNSEPEPSVIDEAKKILDENKKVLNELKEERKKFEKSASEIMLAGKGFSKPQEQPKKETAKEYAERVMRGEIGTKTRKSED